MKKPTVFFSHSTKDKDVVLEIKKKIDSITGGTLDVFMSSDGQSIPLGRNWVHKIEDGLKAAEIMFVFVTPNSVLSNWIYFEAGFAYSKDIEVIPVGIGIDIALLKAPLNLLQGFNITSNDSLNNFLTVINKKFDYHFSDGFTEADYRNIVSATNSALGFDMSSIFSYADYELCAEYGDGKGGKISYDIEAFWKRIIDYLTTSDLAFSYDEKGNKVLTAGIKIIFRAGKKQDDKGSMRQDELDRIFITVSPFNIQSTFPVLAQIMSLLCEKEWVYLQFHLNADYAYIRSQEKMSAIMSTMSTDFEFSKSNIGGYRYLKADLPFSVFDKNGWDSRKTPEYVLSLSFHPNSTTATDIIDCIRLLVDNGIIYSQEGQNGK